MQLIQIDSVIKMYIGSGYIPQNYPLPVLVFVDAETGVTIPVVEREKNQGR